MALRQRSRDEIYKELTDVFRDVFDDNQIDLSDETSAKDIAGWDSLATINLAIEAERVFGVKFLTTELSRLKNVGEFVSVITQKLGR